ncbi:MAG: hypothetical protein Q8K99_08755 [Actinomycetota bacterium]|nr:hypothetical protein [Actinomycetota bacterium]
MKIVSLVERDGGRRSFHVDKVNPATITPIRCNNILAESRVHTDESSIYWRIRVDERYYLFISSTYADSEAELRAVI